MTVTTDEWLEGQADRLLAKQRAEADTAKLVATFSAGVASALVASALQVGPPTRLDTQAAWLLAASAALAVILTLSDRLTAANHEGLLEEARLQRWNDKTLLAECRVAALAAVRANEEVLRRIRFILVVQLIVSASAGALGASSLL